MVALNKVVQAVSKHLTIDTEEIMSKTQVTRIVYARSLCMYILFSEYHYSYSELGRRWEQVDHTSARSLCTKIAWEQNKYDNVKNDLEAIREILKQTP